jgi:divalent metal cation (Fe/Co/Zn/Cd) transporter
LLSRLEFQGSLSFVNPLMAESPPAPYSPKTALLRRARALEWFTVAYNVAEGVLSVGAGWLAGSIALVGFGLDSFIEVTSAAALLWRIRLALHRGASVEEEHQAERRALRVVGLTFFLLSAYVAFRSLWMLWRREAPAESMLGIAITALSLILMPWLALAKRRIARALGSRALQADSMETMVCAWLSAVVLAGLAANALWGWWWADPAAALLMVPLILKEGREAWREGGEGG